MPAPIFNGQSLAHRQIQAKRATRRTLMRGTVLAATLASSGFAGAQAQTVMPSGGKVTAGNATIAGTAQSTAITQTSDKAVIDWTAFSIGQGNSVQFNNGNGATLNRVTGGGLSSIDGLLSATGSVYLINPNGVIVGKTGVVKVGGGFIASTLDLSNENFLAGGDQTFAGPSLAPVINLGHVGALGGDVALVAANVRNDGTVDAPNGTLGLLAGSRILMRDSAVDDGKFLVLSGGADTSVTNTGTIAAAAAELRAEGGNVYALAGNTQGVIRATGVSAHGGHIYLSAGSGSVDVAGSTIAATQTGEGGAINITGKTVSVASDATLDASGVTRGGTVTAIADMAAGQLDFHGSTVATGSLNGGFVETSGHSVDFTGARVNTTGAKSGSWLVDPDDLTVDSASATTISTNLATTDVTLQTTSGAASGTGISTSGNGDIVVASDITWGGNHTLTLDAYHSIQINANLTASGAGSLALTTNNGGDYAFAYGKSMSFTGSGGSLTINGAAYTLLYSLADFYQMEDSSGKYALAHTIDASGTTYYRAVVHNFSGHYNHNGVLTGLGNTIDNFTMDAGNDFNPDGLISWNYGTIRDIGMVNAHVVGGFESNGILVGWNWAGTVKNAFSTGTIYGPWGVVGGLIGMNGGDNSQGSGHITNVFSTADVSGSTILGGLLAVNQGSGIVSDVYASGSVTATSDKAGGLVGENAGSLTNAYASGAVTAPVSSGGLVGLGEDWNGQIGSVTNSFYDSETSGQSDTGKGTALTTADLTGNGLPSGFGANWSFTNGLYPYLTNIGLQTISGHAYDNNGSAAYLATLALYSGGKLLGGSTVTSAVDGSYSVISLPGVSRVGVTETLNNALSIGGATYSDLLGNDIVVNSGTFAYATDLGSSSGLDTAASSAFGASRYSSLTGSLAVPVSIYAKSAFTVDTALTDASGLTIRTGGGDLTVASDLTVSGANSLTLDSYGSIVVAANINATASSGAQVTLATNDGGTGGDYAFQVGNSLTFGGTSDALTINGDSYTLLDSLSALPGLNFATGRYALTRSLDASTTPYSDSVVDYFMGTFEGLGHTIDSLTINNTMTGQQVGLFGYLDGTVRDLGLTNANISVQTMGMNGYAGTMAGLIYLNGTLQNVYSTGSVALTEGNAAGGLAGINYGHITNAFSTASVTGTQTASAGGLVGENGNGTLTNTFATGKVTDLGGGAFFGGLVGFNSYATIDSSYATGQVDHTSDSGGLVGYTIGSTISNSYYDSSTSGMSDTGKGTAQTTAQLQGALPSGFSSSTWSTSAGLYPYLKTLFPTGVHVISGTAYTGAGTGAAQAGIGLYKNGQSLATITTGANGYYYYLPLGVGSLTQGDKVGATLTLNGASAFAGDSYTQQANLSSGSLLGLDVRAGALTANQVTDASYSLFLTHVQPNSVFGTNIADQLTTQLTGPLAYTISTTGDFTIDAYDGALPLTVKSGGNLIVSRDITLGSSTALTLDAHDNLQINANIIAPGSNAVSLTAGDGGNGDYSFLTGKSLSFTGTPGGGQTLTINGQGYELLYSIADLQGIDQGGNTEALAVSIDAAGTDYAGDIVGDFYGTFTGLGNAIHNLSLNSPTTDNIGLFGFNDGTVRDIGLAGGTLYGNWYSGPIAANNNGQILNAWSSMDVHAAYRSGGLVGVNNSNISRSHATGSVASNGDNGSGVNDLGGLVGWNQWGQISQSYATGKVTAISNSAGGLVGYNNGGYISDSFATGAVFGDNYVGGLVGYGDNWGEIRDAYATGYVSGASNVGGIAGHVDGMISETYWDTTTSGTGVDIGDGSAYGAVGLTRADLQSGNLPSGFSSSTWSTGSGLYPYLTALFPTGMQAISGQSYDSTGTLAPAATVALYNNGNSVTATTGADGYYYLMTAAGTVTSSSKLGLSETLNGNSQADAAIYTDAPVVTNGQLSGFDITAGSFTYTTADSTYGVLHANAQAAFGSGTYSDLTTALDGAALRIFTAGGFMIDQSLSRSGSILLQSGGDLYLASPASVSSTASGTAVTLAADGSFINAAGSNALSATNGRWLVYTQAHGDATSAATANSFGGLAGKGYYNDAYDFSTSTLASAPNSGNRFVTGYAATLTATPDTQSLTYNGAVQSDTYSLTGYVTAGDRTADVLTGTVGSRIAGSRNAGDYSLTATGNLVSDENYQINYGSGTLTIDKATLTLTASGATKTYDGTTAASGTIGVSGLQTGDSLTDKVQTFASKNAGNETVSVTGYTLSDGNNGGNYTVTTQDAVGHIDKATLTLTASGATKTYDGTTSATGTIGVSGLKTGDSLDDKVQTFASKNAGNETVSVTGYTLSDGNNGSNYTVSTQDAVGHIDKATLTLTASGATKTYDGTTSATGTIGVSGLKTGDSLTDKVQTFASKNAGNETVSVTGYTLSDGNNGGNYTVTTQDAVGHIDKAALTLAAVTDSKTYDATATSTGTVGISGLKGSDTVTGATQSFDSKNAGTRTLSVGGYTVNDGNGGGNYTVSTQTASGNIAKASLTLTASGDSKTYNGTATSAGTVGVSGLKGSDSVTGATQSFDSKNAGARTLLVGGYTVNDGNGGNNYAVTTLTAAGTIDKATLTVGLTGATTKIYDATLSAILTADNYAVTGLVAGDAVTVNLPSTGSYDTANAGSGKTVSVAGLSLSGDDAGNYTANSAASAAIGSIAKASLTVTADNVGKFSGAGDPALAYAVTSGSLKGNDSLTGSLTRTGGENPGTYDIVQGALTASSNYDLSFVKGTFTITAVALQNNPVVNPISSFANQPVIKSSSIVLSSGGPASTDASTTASSSGTAQNASGGDEKATGPGIQAAGQTNNGTCLGGENCANTPYPSNQHISSSISFAGQ